MHIIRYAAIAAACGIVWSSNGCQNHQVNTKERIVICSDGTLSLSVEQLNLFAFFTLQQESDAAGSLACPQFSCSRLERAITLYSRIQHNRQALYDVSIDNLIAIVFDLDRLALTDRELLADLCSSSVACSNKRFTDAERELIESIASYNFETISEALTNHPSDNDKPWLFDLSKKNVSSLGCIFQRIAYFPIKPRMITILDLSENRINTLAFIGRQLRGVFPNVQTINLANNTITECTASDLKQLRSACPKLNDLNLAANAITTIDEHAADSLEGMWVDLRGNPIASLPMNKLQKLFNTIIWARNTPVAQQLRTKEWSGFAKSYNCLVKQASFKNAYSGLMKQAFVRYCGAWLFYYTIYKINKENFVCRSFHHLISAGFGETVGAILGGVFLFLPSDQEHRLLLENVFAKLSSYESPIIHALRTLKNVQPLKIYY